MTRLRAHTKGILHEDKIINTLLDLKKRGLYNNTLKTTSQKLNQLGRNTDLTKPQEVLTFIANHKVSNSAKQKLANCYAYFCKTNGIQFDKPNHKQNNKPNQKLANGNNYHSNLFIHHL